MISLTSQDEVPNMIEYNYGEHSQNGRSKVRISRDEQLRRGRESAKHSRLRRK